MAKFVLKNIEAVKGKQQFKQLVILDDNEDADKIQKTIFFNEANNNHVEINGVLDDYENNLEAKYKSSFTGIISIMNRVASLQGVPDTKFKDITPKGEAVKEYEFKYQDLRVFAISIFGGSLLF